MHRMLAAAVCCALGFAVQQGAAQQPARPGPATDWNPRPLAQDFVLPLPCGVSMAFRAIRTSGGQARRTYLDDRQVLLGGAEEELSPSSSLRADYVSGPFVDAEGARYFLLGKYEVTTQQYQAVMAPDCKGAASGPRDVPKTAITWFDAVEFTHRLNQWVYRNRQTSLPKADGVPGFVRLPSEAEWEFAARGGLAVGDAERGNPTFVPSSADLSEYAWFASTALSGSQPQPIGLLKPNPLGLFDILGNAEEIVFEPFRLNRVGRLHGQPGGMIVRGGSYLSSKESMRSSTRTEMPLFNAGTGREVRLPQVGFRIAIGGVAFTTAAAIEASRREWTELQRSNRAGGETDATQILERLIKQNPDPERRRELSEVLAQIGQDRRLRSELEAQSIRALWAHAVTVRWNVITYAQQLDGWTKVVDEPDPSNVAAARKAIARERMVAERTRFDSFLATYLDLVTQLATTYRGRDILKEAKLLQRQLEEIGERDQLEQLDETVKIVTTYQRDAKMRNTRAMRLAVVGQRSWLK